VTIQLNRVPDLAFDARLAGDTGQPIECRVWLPQDACEDAVVETWLSEPEGAPGLIGGKVSPGCEVILSGAWAASIPTGPSRPRMAGRALTWRWALLKRRVLGSMMSWAWVRVFRPAYGARQQPQSAGIVVAVDVLARITLALSQGRA
jgi:hypothetical protein